MVKETVDSLVWLRKQIEEADKTLLCPAASHNRARSRAETWIGIRVSIREAYHLPSFAAVGVRKLSAVA